MADAVRTESDTEIRYVTPDATIVVTKDATNLIVQYIIPFAKPDVPIDSVVEYDSQVKADCEAAGLKVVPG